MLTFTAGLNALIGKGYAKPIVFGALFYNSESGYTWFAEKDFTPTGLNAITGILTSWSPVTEAINPRDHSCSISNCTLAFAEGQVNEVGGAKSIADIFAFATRNYRNRQMTLFLGAEGAAYSDCVLFFDGIVENYYFNEEAKQWIFECVSRGEAYHKDLPPTIVTKEAYPNASDDAIGSPLPIIYGYLYCVSGVSGGHYDKQNGLWKLAPSVCTNRVQGEFTFADHAVSVLNANDVVFGMQSLDTYGEALTDNNANVPVAWTTAPARVRLPIASGLAFYQANFYLPLALLGSKSDYTDIDPVGDGNYLTGITVGDLANVKRLYMRLLSDGGDGQFPVTAVASDLILQAYIASYSGSGNCYLRMWNPANSVEISEAGGFATIGLKTFSFGDVRSSATFRTENDGTTLLAATDQWSFEELARYEFGVYVPATAQIDVAWMCIIARVILSGIEFYVPTAAVVVPHSSGWVNRQVQKTRYEPLPKRIVVEGAQPARSEAVSAIFANCAGRIYGAYIDDMGRSNSHNTGDLIAHSGFILEDLLRSYLNIDGAQIDSASFDAHDADYYAMAFSLNASQMSRDLIQDIGRCSRSIVYRTSNGLWRLFYYPDSPSSADLNVDWQQIKLKTVKPSPPEWLTNDVVVHYNFDFLRRVYLRDVHVSDATSQGVTVDGEKRVAKREINCPYMIHDSQDLSPNTFADELAQFEIDNWKMPHLIVEFDAVDPAIWKLQVGDVITFANVPDSVKDGMYATGGATDYWSSWATPRSKYFVIISCSRQMGIVTYIAMQLHTMTQTEILSIGDDASMNANAPTTNYATGVIECNDHASSSFLKRGLIRFDLSSIPGGATIVSAKLKLWTSGVGGGGGDISVHGCTRAWVENQVTWNIWKTANNWTAGGGDFAAAVDTQTVNATLTLYEFDVTSIVENQILGVYTGGILLKFATENTGSRSASFYQTETSATQYKPTLEVTYRA